MKKMIAFILAAGLLVVSAAAAIIPDGEVCENRDGRQLLVKTFTLDPGTDPDVLIEEPFTREGFDYVFVSIVKEEQPFENKKQHSEMVTVETASKDLSVVLAALAATIPYSDGDYSGTLTLEHTSLQTEVTSYSKKNYTISDTKTFSGLARNDPSLVPKTAVKDGVTLTLQSIEWSVAGTALAGDALVAASYTAVASYSAGTSSKVANGYTTTATYTGELVSSGIGEVVYTVTYLGEPIPEPPPEPEPLSESVSDSAHLIFVGLALALVAAGIAAYLLLRRNTKVYTLTETGDEYERIGTLRLSARHLNIDLTRFKKYPNTESVVEIDSRTARRLFGRLIRIRMRDGTAKHRIEQNGNERYWFTISTLTQEEAE